MISGIVSGQRIRPLIKVVGSMANAAAETATLNANLGAYDVGDLLVAVCDRSNANAGDFDPSAGWTKLFQSNWSANANKVMVAVRRATGSDALSLGGWGTSFYAISILRVKGALASSFSSGVSGSSNPPNVAISGGPRDGLAFATVSYEGGSASGGVPTGYTDHGRNGFNRVHVASKVITAATSEDPDAFPFSVGPTNLVSSTFFIPRI